MILTNKQVLAYIFFSYVLSFLLKGVVIWGNQYGILLLDTPLGSLVFVLGTLMPTVVAGVILLKYRYVSSIKQLTQIIFKFKDSYKYYLLVLGFVVLQYIVVALTSPLNKNVRFYVPLVMTILCVFDGGLEEIGWRYLLGPTLESKMNFISATLITATVWIFWHIPHFFVAGTGQSKMSFVLFAFFVVGVSFALATIYRITQNTWLCILCHSMINGVSFCWPIGVDSIPTILTTGIIIVVSIIIVKYDEEGKEGCHGTNE
ncbi:MAG: CPBP family intramembrane glutamic endopeptidase [Cellulosilyticaceae bacterium]